MMAGFELEFVLLKPANLELFRTFPEAAKGANVLLAAGQAWVPVDDAIYGQASAMSTSTMAGGWLLLLMVLVVVLLLLVVVVVMVCGMHCCLELLSAKHVDG
jgi:hypothetical protein